MADAPKILGQVSPGAGVVTDLYAVPGSIIGTVVSSIVVTNTANTATTFRVSLAQAGAADAPGQYLYYDQFLAGNDAFAINLGICLAPTDKIRCRTAAAGTVNFTATGTELS